MASHLIGQNPVSTLVSPTNGTSPIDANTVRGNDNTIATAYTTHDANPTVHVQDSILGSRPAAATAGRKWLTTDASAFYLFYDDGSAWNEISYQRAGGGTISGQVTIVSTTTPQLTVEYDGSHTMTVSVASNGNATLNATGTVTITPATTISAALTYGGVTLSNAVTGTGNMVLSASPTFTGTVTASILATSGQHTSTASGLLYSRTGVSAALQYFDIGNTTGRLNFGIEGSAGAQIVAGSNPYDLVINNVANTSIRFAVDNAIAATLTNAGVFSVGSGMTVTGTGALSGITTLSSGPVTSTGSSAAFTSNPRTGTGTAWSIYNPTGIDFRLFSTFDAFILNNAGQLTLTTTGATIPSSISLIPGTNTNSAFLLTSNGGGINYFGTENSAGSTFGANAYAAVVYSVNAFRLFTNGTSAIDVSTSQVVRMFHYGAGTATFDASGNITSVSDESHKTAIRPYATGLAALRLLEPIAYHFNEASGLDLANEYTGFSAQNLQVAMPENVFEKHGVLSMWDRGVIAASVNAIKELDARLTTLESRITS